MRRRFYISLLVALGAGVGGAVAAFAFFSTSATTAQMASASYLTPPAVATATAASSTTVTVAVTTGTTAPAATGYLVYPHNSTSGPACTITGATGTCTISGISAGSTTSYDVYSTFAAWTSAAAAVVTATTPPAKPTAVTLLGSGTGQAYVNAGNMSAVEIDVALPATSTTADTIHLTVSDGTTTVTPTVRAASAGSGVVAFTGVNLSTLGDGALTLASWSTNAGGSSVNTSGSSFKDVSAPAPTVTTPISTSSTPTFTGTGGTRSADATHTADAGSVTVKVYLGTNQAGSPVQTLTAVVGSGGAWSVAASGALTSGQQYTVVASQSDTAGNTGSSNPTTFTAGPLPPVALKLVNTSGGDLSASGYVEMIDANGTPVANTTGATITVTVSGGALGGHATVHIKSGDTLSEQYTVYLPLGNPISATATYNGQTLHT
ncbi:MAG TPA: hypothetical protein VG650_05995 [Mycobacteriales bacterium]|nr:hypothetical protein [Mycobacteriales bacterium]